jgi:protein SSD1
MSTNTQTSSSKRLEKSLRLWAWFGKIHLTDLLVQQFMLLANIAAAQKIALGLPDQALLRRHEPPIERRLEGFEKRAKALGFDMDISSAGSLMRSFERLDGKDNQVVQLLALKSMLRAKYFCAGMLDISKYQHYALNIPMVSSLRYRPTFADGG